MKTRSDLSAKSKLRHALFALICVLIASVGWAAKLELNQFEKMEDELEQEFKHPCMANTRPREQQNSLIAPGQISITDKGLKPRAPEKPTVTRIN